MCSGIVRLILYSFRIPQFMGRTEKRKKTLEDILPRMSNKYIADPGLSDHHTTKNSFTPEIAIAIR